MVKVGIIGAGASGLCAIKSCLDEGLDPFCFEQHDDIGGVWYYSDKRRRNQGACVSKNVVTNISKYNMSFTQYMMMDDEYPNFMPHEKYQEYLQKYASRYSLLNYVKFSTRVLNIKKDSLSHKWIFQLEDSDMNVYELTFDSVMICSGFPKEETVPNITGINDFRGSMYHSIDYRQPDLFTDKTVLVIGSASTAGDIATDASFVAKRVYLSAGDGMSLIPRSYLSKPRDLKNSRFLHAFVPGWIKKKLTVQRLTASFPHEKYGLGKVRDPSSDGAAAVTDDLQFKIVSGKVEVVPRVVEFEEDTFITIDGVRRKADLVMLCTGYHSKFDFLSLVDIEEKHSATVDVYKTVFPVSETSGTLAFINALTAVVGGHAPIIEMSCRWATRVFAGKVKLPSKGHMITEIEKRKKFLQQHCRNRFKVSWITRCNEMADEIGCRPSFFNLFFMSPSTAFKVLFGPAIGLHYRLVGPGSDISAWKISNDIYNLYETSISNFLFKLMYVPILFSAFIFSAYSFLF